MDIHHYLQSRYTKKTAEGYKREIEIYLSNFKQAETAVYKEIVHYIGQLRKRYNKPSTLNRILSSIKSYYDYLCYTGKRKDNPARAILLRDRQNRSIQLQDLFTTEELQSLLNSKKERYNTLEYRNKVLIGLIIYQALKPNEIEALTITDINLEQGTIYIKSSSKNNRRTLQLKTNQILLFHKYITEIRTKLLKGAITNEFMIGSTGTPMKAEDITKHIKRAYKGTLGTRKINAQTIRQSVITNLLKQNNDLRIVQTFAGHKYPSTTEKYKQNNVDALRTAIQQYHPVQ